MRLEHFRSDYNGIKCKINHEPPTINEVKQVHHNQRVIRENGVRVFADDNMVEVRLKTTNGIGLNSYRDFYRIVN